MIPGAFVQAIDWLYSTEKTWRRLRKGSVRRRGYLAVAMRLAERQRGPRGTSRGRAAVQSELERR